MEQHIDEIEKYLNNELSSDEKGKFEERIKTDPAFLQFFKKYLIARESIKIEADNKLKNHLNILGKELLQKKRAQPVVFHKKKIVWYSVAASILLLFGIYFIVRVLTTEHKSIQELYAENYRDPDISDDLMRSGTSENDNWKIAVAYYEKKDFEHSKLLLEAIIREDSLQQNSVNNFYLAICYLQTGLPDMALQHLQKVGKACNKYKDAQWYMGLVYLKLNQCEMAKALFVNIASEERNKFRGQAKNIEKMLACLGKK